MRARSVSAHRSDDPLLPQPGKLALEAQVAQLKTLLDQEALGELRNAAHQIKGTGGVYGFGTLTDAAAKVEAHIDGAGQAEQIAADVRSLIELMRAVEGYAKEKELMTGAVQEDRS